MRQGALAEVEGDLVGVADDRETAAAFDQVPAAAARRGPTSGPGRGRARAGAGTTGCPGESPPAPRGWRSGAEPWATGRRSWRPGVPTRSRRGGRAGRDGRKDRAEGTRRARGGRRGADLRAARQTPRSVYSGGGLASYAWHASRPGGQFGWLKEQSGAQQRSPAQPLTRSAGSHTWPGAQSVSPSQGIPAPAGRPRRVAADETVGAARAHAQGGRRRAVLRQRVAQRITEVAGRRLHVAARAWIFAAVVLVAQTEATPAQVGEALEVPAHQPRAAVVEAAVAVALASRTARRDPPDRRRAAHSARRSSRPPPSTRTGCTV